MKHRSRTDRLTLLLTGLFVLAVPLWFFNSLLLTALERARESANGLLREKILQTAEQARQRMLPGNYVKESIRKIHHELLPEINSDILRMKPDRNFGHDHFNAELPQKILHKLRSIGLDAILILVNPPEFTDGFYWFSDSLKEQCQMPVELAMDQTWLSYNNAARLLTQRYQKHWYWYRAFKLPPYLLKAISLERGMYNFAYLSRFSEMIGVQDQVDEYFTDYFGQQSIYYYSYSCVSSENLHGAYSVIVPQDSIDPQAILTSAIGVRVKDLTVSLIEMETARTGFYDTRHGMEYYATPPSEFWSHYHFSAGKSRKRLKTEKNALHLKVSGTLPGTLASQEKQYALFRLIASLSLFGYFALAVRYWFFGFNPGLSISRKLAFILGIIVMLPILGVGILTFLALRGSDRVIENQLVQQTVNEIKQLALLSNENLLRQMVAALEVKRRLEQEETQQEEFLKALYRRGDSLTWFTTWTNSISTTYESGKQTQTSGFKDPMPANRLINSLLSKYLDNLGLAKIKSGSRGIDLQRTMTLGMMENYMTPEMEEAWMVHESTVQREITHTADTSRAALYLVRNKLGHYTLLYHRICNTDEHVYRFLSRFNNNDPSWFIKNGRYGDVSMGVRLRRFLELYMFAWPTDALLAPDMNYNFDRAISTRDFGQSILRNDNQIEVRAWRYNDGETAIIGAVGKSRGTSFAGFATSMVFPFMLGYSILVLYFITAIVAEFINGPLRIFKTGIDSLNRENYGVMIASFSGDEFDKITRAFNEMSNALRQREMMKRYVSQKLIQQVQTTSIIEKGQSGQLIQVTVLASDIRGFTSISEKYSPAEVVEMLNSYFTLMEEAINEYGGIIDKYIGDAVQAVFYEDNATENATVRACRAAVRMRQKLAELNQARVRNGLFTIDNGIGIDSGLVISGSIGSETGRKDFTVTGKIIEQAAMLESKTPGTESRILLSLAACSSAASAVSCRAFNEEAAELLHV